MNIVPKSTTSITRTPRGIITVSQQSALFETLSSVSKFGVNLEYPRIVSVGNQSSGKSSLTEAAIGLNDLFLKKAGMATRRPTFITLVQSRDGDDFIKIGAIGEKIYDVARARQRLFEENDGDVTDKPLEIIISSANIQKPCMFVDLPGFITATKSDEDSSLPKKIREICLPYITKDENIKMVVMSATEDPALSYALKLVKKHNQMDNSFAVFTKIDMITNERLKAAPLLSLLRDDSYIPKLGVARSASTFTGRSRVQCYNRRSIEE